MLPATSVNKRCYSHLSIILQLPDSEPWGNSGWKQDAHSLAPQMRDPLTMRILRVRKCRILAPDSWGANKGMISVSLDACIFPNRKVLNSLTWDVWFSLINSNLLMFWLPGFCCKTPLYPGSSLTSSERFLRTMWEVVFRACVLSFVCQTKHNSQLLGHAFLFFSQPWSNKLPWRQTHTARN